MIRRGLLIGGLGLSLSAAGATGLRLVPAAAQDATGTPEATTEATGTSGSATREEFLAERQALIDDFLAKFTANLGLSDPEVVETAFKDTLKQMIDEQLAAGDIAANRAAELKARIDAADSIADLGLGFPGLGGRGGRFELGRGGNGPAGRDGRHGRLGGGRGAREARPGESANPGASALPATDEASGTPTS